MVNNVLTWITQQFTKYPWLTVAVPIACAIIGAMWKKIWHGTHTLFSWLWAKLQGQGKDHAFKKRYLDFLIDQHRHLGLIPSQSVLRRWGEQPQLVNLEQVYVRLSMSVRGGDEDWATTYGGGERSWRKRPSWILRRFRAILPSIFAEKTYQSGDLGLVVDRHKRLVLRGHPGSGKTTLLRYLAVTCARSLRNKQKDGDSSRLVKQRLLWDTKPFPIFVTLKRHSQAAAWDDAHMLTDIFLEELPPELSRQCPPGFFERQLKRGNCLLLFDAFDELGTPALRAVVARRLAGFLQTYDRVDNRFVVTTRIVGYEGQLDRLDFAVRTVQDLQKGEVRALVKLRYTAIAKLEAAHHKPSEARAIEQQLRQRAERLIERIETTPRLQELATTPMLLSLMVLIHRTRLELPEERIFLYRDCVELLTEGWKKEKNAEAGILTEEKELTLAQKLILLREIAFAMQKQRGDEQSQVLIERDAARAILLANLPDFLAEELPEDEKARKAICERKADEWIDGIRTESGILVQQGLDNDGKTVLGFSHLTFQEYLAAEAMKETETYRLLLPHNLLKPAWREVVLLYVALIDDATPIVSGLLQSPTQPQGIFLAGSCLAERVKKIEANTRQKVLTKLKEDFLHVDVSHTAAFGNLLGLLKNSEVTLFLLSQINNPDSAKQVAVLQALGQIRKDDPALADVQQGLVHILETSENATITVPAREALAQIDDPRFSGTEPIMVHIPRLVPGTLGHIESAKKLLTSFQWKKRRQWAHALERSLSLWMYTRWQALWHRRQPYKDFEIGMYPITNVEYSRFIDATNHKPPKQWLEGAYHQQEATHPVAGVTRRDADAYCKWLSQKTGKKYRLPTEWEWEWAASGGSRQDYPWGNIFAQDKCNTREVHLERTTPVGSYIAGKNMYGLSDMSGNILEITHMHASTFLLALASGLVSGLGLGLGLASGLVLVLVLYLGLDLNLSLVLGMGLILFLCLTLFLVLDLISDLDLGLGLDSFLSLVLGLGLGLDLGLGLGLGLVSFLGLVLVLLLDLILTNKSYSTILRGGGWNSPFDEATCLYRTSYANTGTKYYGFRCVREL